MRSRWFVSGVFLLASAAQAAEGRNVDWVANWIWQRGPEGTPQALRIPGVPLSGPAGPSSQNLYFYFRKQFDLGGAPARALAHVSADSRYKLYVNGQYVGRGPARSDPVWQYYDTYDITRFLKPGQNVVAAVYHFFGVSTGQYLLGRGGFLFQGEITGANATKVIGTDDTWKVRRALAWDQNAPRINDLRGFVDIYDARREPRGWESPGYDDSGWDAAVVVASRNGTAQLPVPPWQSLVPRDIPFLLEEERLPARVLAMGEVQNYRHPSISDPDNIAQQMAGETPGPLRTARFVNPEGILHTGGARVTVHPPVKPHAARRNSYAYMVLDFGKILTGYPRITISKGVPGGIIDIGLSEGLSNGRVAAATEFGRHVHRYVMREGSQSFETTELESMRYVQLTFRDLTEPLDIDSVSVNFSTYPVEHRGRFHSSDELLDRIWQAGAYTVQLCMRDAYEDCPSREQSQWLDDSKIEALVNYAAFGDTLLIRKLLRQGAQSQDSDGMIMQVYPGTAPNGRPRPPHTEVDCGLLWVQQIRDYYMHTGDAGLVRELYPAVVRLIAWFENYIDRHGLLNNIPEWVFIDWAQLDKRGEITALNGLFAGTLLDAAALAEVAGDPARAARFRAMYEGIGKGVNARLWDAGRGVYVDCHDGVPSRRVSQQTNGVLLYYDLVPAERRPGVIAYITDENRLVLTGAGFGIFANWAGPPFDKEKNVVLTQPYFGHFVLNGLVRAGALDRALAMIRKHWGGMIRQGADTFWEIWSPKVSNVHGWSATPTWQLSTHILGVRPTQPGFAEFLVEPNPADLSFAEGVFPTVKGDIRVSWKSQPDRFSLDVVVPKGARAVASLPRVPAATTVLINGQPVAGIREEQGRRKVPLPADGSYRVELR